MLVGWCGGEERVGEFEWQIQGREVKELPGLNIALVGR